MSNMDWVLAELVRLYHNTSADEAHQIITELVSKAVPAIQVFDGYPRILKALSAPDYVLVLLYWKGRQAVPMVDLRSWTRPSMRANLGRTIKLMDERHLVHAVDAGRATGSVTITSMGEREVEERGLVESM